MPNAARILRWFVDFGCKRISKQINKQILKFICQWLVDVDLFERFIYTFILV